MATASFTGLTTVGSSNTGLSGDWTNIGAGPGGGQNTDDYIEGTDSFGGRKTVSGRGIAYLQGAGSNDFSGGQHLGVWINCKSIGALQTIANGGMILRVGSSASAYRSFYIGGSDVTKAGWQYYVIDPTKTGSISDTGSPNFAAVTYIGVELTLVSTPGGTSDNILMDVIHRIVTPYITGGTSGDRLKWSDVAAAAVTPAYGIIQQRAGVYFVKGRITIGAPSGIVTSTYFDDGGQIIVWEPQEYHNGTSLVSSLASGWNRFMVQEGLGTTEFEDGTLVGSGDDRTGTGGSVFKKAGLGLLGSANSNDLDLVLSGAITAVDMHGTVFDGFDGTTTELSDDATDGPNHVYAGCLFTGCEMIDSGRAVIRNCVFSGYAGTQGALNWQANGNIRNSSFLANTDATNDPAGIYHLTEGDFSYIGLLFSGNDVDVRNANAATSVQAYANTNQDSEVNIGNGTLDGVAQSFAGVAGQLVRAQFYLRKVGSPTGNATVKLYAHSGTFGTSSIPTGATLVASTVLDVSTLTGSLADVDFYFEAAAFYDLVGATNYCIAIEYTGGDGSNYVAVGYDASSPTSAGNAATLASGGGWSAQTYDLIHAVWRDGEVQVNASSGANPTTKSRTGSPASAISIINTVSLKVTVLDESGAPVQNAQTGIYALESAGGVTKGDELISGSGGSDTNASGIVENANYNYGGAVNVEVRSRKSSAADTPRYKHLRSPQVIGASGLTVTVTLLEDPQNN